jgi:hypothetical protein
VGGAHFTRPDLVRPRRAHRDDHADDGALRDPKRRQAILHQIQRLAYERVMHAPLWELGFLNAIGPRVEESGLGLIALHPYSAPYEDLKLRK